MSGSVHSYAAKPQIARTMAGLITTAITDITKGWVTQLVDIAGVAVLYSNEKGSVDHNSLQNAECKLFLLTVPSATVA